MSDDYFTKSGAEKVILPSPLGNNSVISLKTIFDDKNYYYNLIVPNVYYNLNGNFPFGDLLKQNSLYGLVDKDLNIILPNQKYMKEISSGDKDKKYVMDFVADAFNEMNAYLSRAALTGKISRDGPYYNLKCFRSYVNMDSILLSSQVDLILKFNKYFLADKGISAKIKDPKSFNNVFLNFIKQQINNSYPISVSYTTLSSNFYSFEIGRAHV